MTHAWVYDKESLFDFLGFMIEYTPEYPEEDFLEPHEQLNLERAFDELKRGLAIVKPSYTNEAGEVMQNLVTKSYACFQSGDETQGSKYLQQLDDLLHPNKHDGA